MYTTGQLYKKEFKYAMGIPIAVIAVCIQWYWVPVLAILTYFIACEIGYGDHNPLTLLVGKRWAITIHGTAVGLASFPVIGIWCILGGIISGVGFFLIAKFDDDGWLKEPFVAISRGIVGTILLVI
jgi:hypothetical protein